MKPRLLALTGPEKGREFHFLDEPTTVGRGSNNDISLNDETVSDKHFAFFLKDGGPYFKDLKTRNGTEIDAPGLNILAGMARCKEKQVTIASRPNPQVFDGRQFNYDRPER